MTEAEELKRITIQVKPETYEKLTRVVRHGFRRHVLEKLIDLAIDAIERDGDTMTGALLGGDYKLVRTTSREVA
jgi:hypothetical protein